MDSPFNRSAKTPRSPPPTPPPGPLHPSSKQHTQDDLEVVDTPEIQNWMRTIEQCLSEICHISSEGKMNSEQKLRIHNLCRKVTHGTSQMAVLCQSFQSKAVQARRSLQTSQDRKDLSQQLRDLKLSIEESSKPTAVTSFADMVKKGNNEFIKPTNVSSVAIYPTDKQKSSEDTKSLVQKIICPEKMKLHVRGLRKTRNGGVIISTDSKDDIAKLKESVVLTTSGLTVDEPYKRKPRIVVIGVPTSMKENEVFTCLFNQNLADKLPNSDLDSFLSSIKLSHKSGKKDAETCNYVLEVSAIIRKALITSQRVFVNWSSCPVRDFTLVTRCYQCQQYGHAAKTCRETVHTCGHCGEQGHSIKDCTKKENPSKCATCFRFKKPSDHNTGATECPAKIMAEKRYINSIDYGGA